MLQVAANFLEVARTIFERKMRMKAELEQIQCAALCEQQRQKERELQAKADILCSPKSNRVPAPSKKELQASPPEAAAEVATGSSTPEAATPEAPAIITSISMEEKASVTSPCTHIPATVSEWCHGRRCFLEQARSIRKARLPR